MVRALRALTSSSTFWFGLLANLAAFLATGQVSTTLLVATIAGYTAKEGMRYVAERPTAAELELELELERMPKPGHANGDLEEDRDVEEYDRLFATRVRPMLRQLRQARRRQLTEKRPSGGRRGDPFQGGHGGSGAF